MTEERQEVKDMDKSLQLVKTGDFEGIKFDCYQDSGKEFWGTRDQIGKMLGYANPDTAIKNIHLRNQERLDKFSTQLKLSRVEGDREVTREVTVYNFKGLLEICRYSNQPKADAVMDFLWEMADEVRKTGSYSVRTDGANESMKRADAMLNNSRVRLAQFLKEAVRDIWDDLSPEAKQSYSAYMVEQATGKPSPLPMPEMERTYTAKEVGEMAEISANMVGRLANLYKLKTKEYGKTVLDKSPHSSKQVPTFRYNQAGADRIVQLVREGAVIRASDVAQI